MTSDREDCTFELASSNGVIVCKYIVDFMYNENGKVITEDAKGMVTNVYKIKRKWFIADRHLYEHRES